MIETHPEKTAYRLCPRQHLRTDPRQAHRGRQGAIPIFGGTVGRHGYQHRALDAGGTWRAGRCGARSYPRICRMLCSGSLVRSWEVVFARYHWQLKKRKRASLNGGGGHLSNPSYGELHYKGGREESDIKNRVHATRAAGVIFE